MEVEGKQGEDQRSTLHSAPLLPLPQGGKNAPYCRLQTLSRSLVLDELEDLDDEAGIRVGGEEHLLRVGNLTEVTEEEIRISWSVCSTRQEEQEGTNLAST
jgi:hypothetical protein